MRQENNLTFITQSVGAYGVDKDVVKRVNTYKCEY
jgi:hypothetical protein